MKTWKKIEETKKRSSEITNLKRRNDDKMKMKMDAVRMN